MSQPFRVEVRGIPEVQRMLDRINAALDGRTSDLRPLYDEMTAHGSRALLRVFSTQGKRFGGWKRPGPVTKALRTKGRSSQSDIKKVYTMRDLIARPDNAGESSGALRMSFRPGRRGNVRQVSSREAFIGSSLPRARRYNDGGSVTVEYDASMPAQVAKHLSPTKPGRRRPSKRADGKRNQWKRRGKESPWNPDYGRLISMMEHKMDGKAYRFPRRQIAPEPFPFTQTELRDIARTGTLHVQHMLDMTAAEARRAIR